MLSRRSPSDQLLILVAAILVFVVIVALSRHPPTQSPIAALATASVTDDVRPAPDDTALDAETEEPIAQVDPVAIVPTAIPTPARTLAAAGLPTNPLQSCSPTDQDAYVYNPTRLLVLASCIRITGVVQAVRKEADGDFHILVHLDSEYAYVLRPANDGTELGDLVVEPVCILPVTQASAIQACASDPDPLPSPFPQVGNHVWLEGRYVLDLEHGGWAELHPLYRWGSI